MLVARTTVALGFLGLALAGAGTAASVERARSSGATETRLVPLGASASVSVRPRDGAGGAEWSVGCPRAPFRWRWRAAGGELEVLDLGFAVPLWRPPARGGVPRLTTEGDVWTLADQDAATHRLEARGRSVRIEGPGAGPVTPTAPASGTLRGLRFDLAAGIDAFALVVPEQGARFASAFRDGAEGADGALWLTWSDELADVLPARPRAEGTAARDAFFVDGAGVDADALAAFGVRDVVTTADARAVPWSLDAWRRGEADVFVFRTADDGAVPLPHFAHVAIAPSAAIAVLPREGASRREIDRTRARALVLGAAGAERSGDVASIARTWWATAESAQRVSRAAGADSIVTYRLADGSWTSLAGAVAAGELDEVVRAVHVRHADGTAAWVNLTDEALDVVAEHGRGRRLAPRGRLLQAPDFEGGLLEARGIAYEFARGPSRFFLDSRGERVEVELLRLRGAVGFDLGSVPAAIHPLPPDASGPTSELALSPSWVTRLAGNPWATWYEMEATWSGPEVEPLVERLRCDEQHWLELDPARWNEQGFTRLSLVSLAPSELRPMGH